jgi:GH15 family glucan-1,4-alpha-glucosidase
MSLNLEDYGIIGDTHTAAVVGLNGSIDWMCLPRFDSAACFAALLGGEENGCWRIAPVQPCQEISQQYRPDTLILETHFATAEGTVRLIDWMPPREIRPDVIRVVEGIRGEVAMEMKLVLRFDHGMTVPWVQGKDHETTMIAGPKALLLRSDVKTRGEGLSTVAEFTIAEGERKFGSDNLDASLLMIPLVGFLPPRTSASAPRWNAFKTN